ncbi:hypothetical protein TIFTF001_021760 [Ficus carica]|uniref:Uncharacterized protein n=1 Tax=Ficus carica TaxID=3494 RepID=A0AA88AHC3_FICCA|nr:hypothetical protein TIFTF001_021760 [Ficus carica]
MVRLRVAIVLVAPDMGTAAIIADLVARLESQERETRALRLQLAQQNETILTMRTQQFVNQEPLYEHFRRMKPPEFEGSIDPLEAEDWDARYCWETVMMRRNVMDMNWEDFLEEFKK